MKTIALLTLMLSISFSVGAEPTANSAQTKAAEARQMLPYDADQALEGFSKTVYGGIMHILAKVDGDSRQIKNIQRYLRQTTKEYRNGDFSSTERFHGSDMPGLARMKAAKTDDIKYEFKALKNGGQIHFSTEYPELLNALHTWLDAQIAAHGSAPLPGHSQHHASPAE
jgi:hypothetical protein